MSFRRHSRKLHQSQTFTRLEELVTCAVCHEFLKNPKVLPCLHSYCHDCIVELSKRECGLECPECRSPVEVRTWDHCCKHVHKYSIISYGYTTTGHVWDICLRWFRPVLYEAFQWRQMQFKQLIDNEMIHLFYRLFKLHSTRLKCDM